jgi:predicted transcriptional regulator
MMKEITKAQEDILKALWGIKDGAVNDVLDVLPKAKPAYNTVSTVLKVLEKKGYVSHRTYGKTNVYFTLISKKKYAKYHIKNIFKELYNNSINQMVSPFIKSKNVSLKELEELKSILEKEIKNKKK